MINCPFFLSTPCTTPNFSMNNPMLGPEQKINGNGWRINSVMSMEPKNLFFLIIFTPAQELLIIVRLENNKSGQLNTTQDILKCGDNIKIRLLWNSVGMITGRT